MTDSPLDSSSPSRIVAARSRTRVAKSVVAVAAATAFGVTALAVRASHPGGSGSEPVTPSTSLAPPDDFVTALDELDLGGGAVAPPTGAPDAGTHTS